MGNYANTLRRRIKPGCFAIRIKSHVKYIIKQLIDFFLENVLREGNRNISEEDLVIYMTLHSVSTKPSGFCYENQLDIGPERLNELVKSLKEYGTFVDPRMIINGSAIKG